MSLRASVGSTEASAGLPARVGVVGRMLLAYEKIVISSINPMNWVAWRRHRPLGPGGLRVGRIRTRTAGSGGTRPSKIRPSVPDGPSATTIGPPNRTGAPSLADR